MSSSRTNGTLKQPIVIDIDYSRLHDKIMEDLNNLITPLLIEAIKDQSDDVEIDENFDEDDESIYKSATYETSYSSYYSAATRECPEEYDFERECEELDETQINKIINSKLPEMFKDMITIHISEDASDAEAEEYEPDWDSMPGGHDYYD